jgi:hypothetical protein
MVNDFIFMFIWRHTVRRNFSDGHRHFSP